MYVSVRYLSVQVPGQCSTTYVNERNGVNKGKETRKRFNTGKINPPNDDLAAISTEKGSKQVTQLPEALAEKLNIVSRPNVSAVSTFGE